MRRPHAPALAGLLCLLLALVLWALAAGAADSEADGPAFPSDGVESPAPAPGAQQPGPALQAAGADQPAMATMQAGSAPEARLAVESGPSYAGWSEWCEPMYYESQCTTDADCLGQQHPALRGAPLRCLHPWWAETDDLRICAPGGASKTERRWRAARLRELVSQLYFDEPARCPSWRWEMNARPHRARTYARIFADGGGVGRQHWRCQREWRAAEQLANFLAVPYQREVGKRPYKRHRLPADQEANAKAYVRHASAYGWVVELACEKPGRTVENCPRYRRGPRSGKRMTYVAATRPDPEAESHNEHYDDRWRWEYGLGPFGANAALGVQDWDRLAPPEVLCLEVPAVEAYLRDARHAVAVYRNGGVDCGDLRYQGAARRGQLEVAEPSWIDVHRVASSGAWCPRTGSKAAKFRRNFKAQLRARGIDPDQPVTEEMLGRPLAREGQWDRARAVLTHLDEVLPSPWE